VNAPEVVVHIADRQSVIGGLFAESVCKARKPAIAHAQAKVLPLNE
jgi:hypothetical protein